MRRAILAVLALCCFATTAHAAQGVNLAWDACYGDGGVRNKAFACDTNAGSEQLFVSFLLDSVVTPVTGLELTLMVTTPAGAPDSWWQFKTSGSCRATALAASAAPLVPSESCVDFWQGQAAGGIAGYSLVAFAGAYRLSAILALPQPYWALLGDGTEYFAMRLVLSHTKTVGTGACPGCFEPVCIGIEGLRLTRPVGYGDIRLADETSFGSSTVNWQGAAAGSRLVVDPVYPDTRPKYRIVTCASATPARNSTWGSIKSLYH